MEGGNEQDRDRAQALGVDYSAAEGDGDRGRYSLLVRCASQSSLDESSQRPARGDAAADAAPAHASKLLDALARLRTDAALCDVQIQAQADAQAAASAGVCAHRAVLAAASPYFLAMFTQFGERTQPSVTIQNIEPHALEAIIEYIYTPESLVVTEENVQSLLSAASLVQVWGVRAACCSFLAAALAPDNALGIRAFADLHACADLAAAADHYIHLHAAQVSPSPPRAPCCSFLAAALAPDNALGIRAFADLHACADLAAAADHYIHLHAAQVLETEEFLALSPEVLCQLLDSDRITVPNEEVILDAVIRWMQHDPESRRGALGAVLEHVRLPLLAQDVLVARAAAEPLLSAGVRVKDLVIEALSFHLLRPERRAAAAAGSARARPRAPPRPPAPLAALLVAGGQAPKAIRDVEAYHLPCARWRPAAALPARRCRAGLARRGDQVYAVGGFNGTLRVRSVDVYDVAADTWAPGPPLTARRSTLGVAVLGTVIYAVGGFDGVTGLNSAEALDTSVSGAQWRPIAPMSTRRSSVGVAVLDERLYAVGGYDGASRQCLHTVERYDPATDTWESCAEMSARRSGAGVGAVGGALYAVGGHDGPAVRRSVERYTPARGWAPAPPMHSPRRNAAVAAHRGRLYVVGGDDGAANLDTVEVFDPTTETWTVLSERMSVGRSYAGVAVVDWPA